MILSLLAPMASQSWISARRGGISADKQGWEEWFAATAQGQWPMKSARLVVEQNSNTSGSFSTISDALLRAICERPV